MLPFGEGLHEEIEVDESAGIYGDGTSWADDTAFSLSGPCPERHWLMSNGDSEEICEALQQEDFLNTLKEGPSEFLAACLGLCEPESLNQVYREASMLLARLESVDGVTKVVAKRLAESFPTEAAMSKAHDAVGAAELPGGRRSREPSHGPELGEEEGGAWKRALASIRSRPAAERLVSEFLDGQALEWSALVHLLQTSGVPSGRACDIVASLGTDRTRLRQALELELEQSGGGSLGLEPSEVKKALRRLAKDCVVKGDITSDLHDEIAKTTNTQAKLKWPSSGSAIHLQEIVDGWHPAIAVTEQAQIWTLKWNRSFTPHFQLLAYLLSEVPRSPEQQIDFVISAGDLRDSMRAMSSKVGCADCWHHKDLIFSELLGCGILSLTPAKHPGRGKGTGGNPTADMDLVRSVAQAAADAAAAALRGRSEPPPSHAARNGREVALQRSAKYDMAFGLVLSRDTCFIVARTPSVSPQALANEFKFQMAKSLGILGIRAESDGE
ncbi:unnamed protein product [Symbiodinium sp. KB8]|nr:unnamed protein product [Symbiodinium sp. KB8]